MSKLLTLSWTGDKITEVSEVPSTVSEYGLSLFLKQSRGSKHPRYIRIEDAARFGITLEKESDNLPGSDSASVDAANKKQFPETPTPPTSPDSTEITDIEIPDAPANEAPLAPVVATETTDNVNTDGKETEVATVELTDDDFINDFNDGMQLQDMREKYNLAVRAFDKKRKALKLKR